MIEYLLKSTACLALFLTFYKLVLEKEKMHSFNRFYLLGGIIFSFIIPFYVINIYIESPIQQGLENTTSYYVYNNTLEKQNVITPIDYKVYLFGIYISISAILLIRFGKNLSKILKKINNNDKIKYNNASIVLVKDKINPHTFWNYIFINKKDYETKKVEKELYTHELTHVTQKHTLDILLIELLQIVFWINPVIIFVKNAIQLNHEFLADNKVITKHKNTFQYQYLLLDKATWKNEYYLASNLNYLVTKKRLKMMTTKSSKSKILLKKLLVIPILAGLIFLFAEKVKAQKNSIKDERIETIYEQTSANDYETLNSELYKEYVFNKGKIVIKDKNGNTITKSFNELTEDEKKVLPPPPPLKSEKKTPSKTLIEDLKDEKKYAIWIDGKVKNNDVLNNYKNSDFSNYSVSYVHKNARSEKFPQEHQAHLETKTFFDNQNKKRKENYLDYLNKKHNIEEIKEEKDQISNNNESTQSIILNQDNRLNEIKTGFKTIRGKKFYFVNINGVIKYYNKDGKLCNKEGELLSNKKANASEIIPNNYITNVYDNGSIFCEFNDNNPKSLNPLDDYILLNKVYESKRNEKPHYIKSDSKRQKELDELFSELGSLYFKLSKENKRKTKRPIHPYKPYIRLMKNNVVFYKLREDLTTEDELLFPPPPAPQNASNEEKLRAKQAFEEWKQRTGNTFNTPPPPPKKNKN